LNYPGEMVLLRISTRHSCPNAKKRLSNFKDNNNGDKES
jgi:hypothetical protein